MVNRFIQCCFFGFNGDESDFVGKYLYGMEHMDLQSDQCTCCSGNNHTQFVICGNCNEIACQRSLETCDNCGISNCKGCQGNADNIVSSCGHGCRYCDDYNACGSMGDVDQARTACYRCRLEQCRDGINNCDGCRGLLFDRLVEIIDEKQNEIDRLRRDMGQLGVGEDAAAVAIDDDQSSDDEMNDDESITTVTISEGKATRLARRLGIQLVPPSYFESQGHSPVYSQVIVQRFQRRLICCIGEMLFGIKRLRNYQEWKKKELDLELYIGPNCDAVGNVDYDSEEKSNFLVEHDDSFLPLWELFTDTLRNSHVSHKRLLNISIHDVQLNKVVQGMIGKALKGKRVRHLTLDNIGQDLGVVLFESTTIKESSTVRYVCLDDICFNNLDITSKFESAIETHTAMFQVTLSRCEFGSHEILRRVIDAAKGLSYFSLSGSSSIGEKGFSYIADLLKSNPRLKEICLVENNLSEDSIAEIAQAIKFNTNLRSLNLHSNKLTRVCENTLLKAVYDISSLNAISDSNHTCMISADYDYEPTGVYEPFKSLSISRGVRPWEINSAHFRLQFKLYLALGALQTEAINFHYLNEVSLEMLPSVLTFVQKVCDLLPAKVQNGLLGQLVSEFAPINNVYDVVRNCVVPLLFAPEARSSVKRQKCK